jgi:hypothetical protein
MHVPRVPAGQSLLQQQQQLLPCLLLHQRRYETWHSSCWFRSIECRSWHARTPRYVNNMRCAFRRDTGHAVVINCSGCGACSAFCKPCSSSAAAAVHSSNTNSSRSGHMHQNARTLDTLLTLSHVLPTYSNFCLSLTRARRRWEGLRCTTACCAKLVIGPTVTSVYAAYLLPLQVLTTPPETVAARLLLLKDLLPDADVARMVELAPG